MTEAEQKARHQHLLEKSKARREAFKKLQEACKPDIQAVEGASTAGHTTPTGSSPGLAPSTPHT
jgi:hypothetical protein